ncbi:MAG: hypothetical protein V3T38_05915, partial [Gammaproteobacteria bacterium]
VCKSDDAICIQNSKCSSCSHQAKIKRDAVAMQKVVLVGPVGDPREGGCLNDVLRRGGWSAPGDDRVQRWLWLLFQVCMANVHAIRIDKTSIMSLYPLLGCCIRKPGVQKRRADARQEPSSILAYR